MYSFSRSNQNCPLVERFSLVVSFYCPRLQVHGSKLPSPSHPRQLAHSNLGMRGCFPCKPKPITPGFRLLRVDLKVALVYSSKPDHPLIYSIIASLFLSTKISIVIDINQFYYPKSDVHKPYSSHNHVGFFPDPNHRKLLRV